MEDEVGFQVTPCPGLMPVAEMSKVWGPVGGVGCIGSNAGKSASSSSPGGSFI